MENMCSNCGFYKTPPLFWGGSTEPLLCDCPKERSYSEEDLKDAFFEGWIARDGKLTFTKAKNKWFKNK